VAAAGKRCDGLKLLVPLIIKQTLIILILTIHQLGPLIRWKKYLKGISL
jgi:hypothetical protein